MMPTAAQGAATPVWTIVFLHGLESGPAGRCGRARDAPCTWADIRVDEKVGVVIAMRVRTRSKARYIQRHFPAALVPDLQMSAFDVTKKNSAGAPLLSRQRARHGGRDRLEKL